jgi:sugar phosphate isomerase/epimerase
MKIAVSNIAWRPDDDEAIADLLQRYAVAGIEVAPTMIWPNPLDVTPAQAHDYRRRWEDRGMAIVAMQALLFGHPELVIFRDAAARQLTLEYLDRIFTLASWLGATRLVFGSPANRRVGDLAAPASLAIAEQFFRRAGDAAAARGVMLCLEPNPRAYSCDFVNSSGEARALIARVGSPGFGLHLDAGAMTLEREVPSAIVEGGLPKHFHISEPQLAPLGTGGVDHAGFAAALRDSAYDGWCSIEARRPEDQPAASTVEANLARAMKDYGES